MAPRCNVIAAGRDRQDATDSPVAVSGSISASFHFSTVYDHSAGLWRLDSKRIQANVETNTSMTSDCSSLSLSPSFSLLPILFAVHPRPTCISCLYLFVAILAGDERERETKNFSWPSKLLDFRPSRLTKRKQISASRSQRPFFHLFHHPFFSAGPERSQKEVPLINLTSTYLFRNSPSPIGKLQRLD